MGYDLIFVNEPAELAELENRLTTSLQGGPDAPSVSDTYLKRWRILQESGCYFRANIWGMQRLRKLMSIAGMLMDGTGHRNFYWRIPAHKLGSNDGWLVTPDEIAGSLIAYFAEGGKEKVEKVFEEGLEVEDYRVEEGKFIYDTVIEQLDDEMKAWWEEWLNYLARAMKAGGFNVH